MKLIYLSRKAVEALSPLDEPHVFISVTSPGDPDPEAKLPINEKTLGVLRLRFRELYDQIAEERYEYAVQVKVWEREGTAFTRETGRQLLNFVLQHKEAARTIIVHCDGGLARSPGIVRALAETVFAGETLVEETPVYRRAHWPTCYRHTIEAWQDQEEHLLVTLLLHPAGFDVGCCGILGIRSTDQLTYEVVWEGQEPTDYMRTETHTYWTFTDVREAVRFYLKMQADKIGSV